MHHITSRLSIILPATLGLILFALIGCSGEQEATTVTDQPAIASDEQSATAESVADDEAAPLGKSGWYTWRGPHQNGSTAATITSLDQAWKKEGLKGRGTPVLHGDRLYAFAYEGERDQLLEMLICLNAASGEEIWRVEFPDFISDNIYDRYAIGSPVIDPETGHIYLQTSPGLMTAFDRDGKILWQQSMTETFGRLSFPNGRTGSPVLHGDLVIVHGITSSWGAQGPGRDRLIAFEKSSGDVVWISAPGTGPPFLKDSSFSTPIFEWRGQRNVLYVGTGCGNVAAVNADTGEPLWRMQVSLGGVNSSLVIDGDHLIAVHGKENLDSTDVGGMLAIPLPMPADYEDGDGEATLINNLIKPRWRNDLTAFTSSPTLGDGVVYVTNSTGELASVDTATGEINWHLKLANSQLHASPLLAGERIYVPFENGRFFVIDVSGDEPEVVREVELGGRAYGQPAIHDGRIYVFSTNGLYAFGDGQGEPVEVVEDLRAMTKDMPRPEVILPVPMELTMRPGETRSFKVWVMDRKGRHSDMLDRAGLTWEKYIPKAAAVRTEMDATIEGSRITAEDKAKLSAGAFRVSHAELALSATGRGRVIPEPPYAIDFEAVELSQDHAGDGVKFAHPPLPWIGARAKWEVREVDGTKALAKTLDNVLFQRAIAWIGAATDRNYTIAADVRTDRARRVTGEVGLINQRYLITLKGIQQEIEVSSNHERLKVSAPFTIRPETWYTLKTRVDLNEDDRGGVVRAKAWERGTAEPSEWTIEVPVHVAHREGSPGLFGFSPQAMVRVWIDNVRVTPNE